jgi:hypothetical protein
MNIKEDNIQKLLKYKSNPPNPSYIAGFIDGDGTIFIRKIKDGYQSGISITQSRTNILQILQYHFGGTIIKPSSLNTENIFNEDGYYDKNNKRNSYTLTIRSNEYKYLLNYICDKFILKEDQINSLLKFEKIVNKIELKEEKENLCNICLNINKNKKLINYDYSKLNIEYIQGIFDAEGHVNIGFRRDENNKIKFSKGIYMKITQKNHPEIIKEIQKFLGFGKSSDYIYYVDNFEDCLKLIKLIKDGLIVKYNQVIAFEEYINSRLEKSEKYNEEIHIKREKIYKIINMEKHQIEIYNEADNKEGYNKKVLLDLEKQNIEKEEKKKEFYIKKAESMTGLNNPNYGQHLSNEHALNISIGTTIAKRSNNPNLTNDKIREIYDLKDKIMQKDVAEKYGMNREIIRRIWNRLIIPTDDPDFLIKKTELVSKENSLSSDNLTFEQKTSLGKRSLSTIQYVEIILWKIKKNNGELLNDKKIFSTTLADYLTKIWNTKVTNDMIKNIWSGKTKLFDFEFNNSEISYEKYLEVVSK